MATIELKHQSLRNGNNIDVLRYGFRIEFGNDWRVEFFVRIMYRKVIIWKNSPVSVFPENNLPFPFALYLSGSFSPSRRMSVKTDQNAIEIIDLSQFQQSLCEYVSGIPELRGGKASLKEHMPDAHLAHYRHTVWLLQIHGPLNPRPGEHVLIIRID
jgi:hypothetical protein